MATLSGHTQEVCGLKWSLDGRYLASGGNDNLVNIWPCTQGDSGDYAPVQTFTQHQGAVKVSVVPLWVGRMSVCEVDVQHLLYPLPCGREAAVELLWPGRWDVQLGNRLPLVPLTMNPFFLRLWPGVRGSQMF